MMKFKNSIWEHSMDFIFSDYDIIKCLSNTYTTVMICKNIFIIKVHLKLSILIDNPPKNIRNCDLVDRVVNLDGLLPELAERLLCTKLYVALPIDRWVVLQIVRKVALPIDRWMALDLRNTNSIEFLCSYKQKISGMWLWIQSVDEDYQIYSGL